LWAADTGKLKAQRALADQPGDLDYSADGKLVAAVHWGGGVEVWEAATLKPLWRAAGHAGGRTAVRFSPDGKHLASVGCDNVLRLWEASTGKRHRTCQHGGKGYQTAVAFRPDGKQVITAGLYHPGRAVRYTWDVQSGKLVTTGEEEDGRLVDHIAFSQRGALISSTSAGLWVSSTWQSKARYCLWEIREEARQSMYRFVALVLTILFAAGTLAAPAPFPQHRGPWLSGWDRPVDQARTVVSIGLAAL
jgi:WD40 repeat protein